MNSKVNFNSWLVRTEKNQIQGPFSKARLQEMILNRELTEQDEVCAGNYYWIFIHERGEVQEQVGVEVPRDPDHSDHDVTETELTDPNIGTHSSGPEREVPTSVMNKAVATQINSSSVVGYSTRSSRVGRAIWVWIGILGLAAIAGLWILGK